MLPVLSLGWTTPARLLSIQLRRLLQDVHFKAPWTGGPQNALAGEGVRAVCCSLSVSPLETDISFTCLGSKKRDTRADHCTP